MTPSHTAYFVSKRLFFGPLVFDCSIPVSLSVLPLFCSTPLPLFSHSHFLQLAQSHLPLIVLFFLFFFLFLIHNSILPPLFSQTFFFFPVILLPPSPFSPPHPQVQTSMTIEQDTPRPLHLARPTRPLQPIRPAYNTPPPYTHDTAADSDVIHVTIYQDPATGKDIVFWEDILVVFKGALNIRQGTRVIPFLRGNDFKTYVSLALFLFCC